MPVSPPVSPRRRFVAEFREDGYDPTMLIGRVGVQLGERRRYQRIVLPREQAQDLYIRLIASALFSTGVLLHEAAMEHRAPEDLELPPSRDVEPRDTVRMIRAINRAIAKARRDLDLPPVIMYDETARFQNERRSVRGLIRQQAPALAGNPDTLDEIPDQAYWVTALPNLTA